MIRIICSLLVISTIVNGQLNYDTRAFGLAEATIALQKNNWATFSNPANLDDEKQIVFSVFYMPSKFGINELKNGGFLLFKKTELGNFSISGNLYGFELYKESELSLSYSNSLIKDVRLGINFNYHNLSIKNYGNKGLVSFDLGISAKLFDEFYLASFLKNITNSKWVDGEKLPQILSFGFSYYILNNVILLSAMEKEINYDLDYRVGVEYSLLNTLILRTGYKTLSGMVSFGLGISVIGGVFDYGLGYHNELGLSHIFGLTYSL